MTERESDLQQELTSMMNRYGIDFSVVRNFKGAPVQGYKTPIRSPPADKLSAGGKITYG